MKAKKLNSEIIKVYNEKGLNGVHSFLKRNGISYKQTVVEFGLHTSKKAIEEKNNWINHNDLKFHYYSLGIKGRKNGYSYNRIRGTQIIIK